MRMRNMPKFLAYVFALAAAAVGANTHAAEDNPESPSVVTIDQGALLIEIHPPPEEIPFVGEPVSVDIEGVASAIGGVRYLDIMLVMDTSMSLRKSDPDNYRATGAIGLVENLSPKSDTNLGVVSFDDGSKLIQPLTSDRPLVVQSLQDLKRSGGTNIAAGIRTALEELAKNGRPDSSRVILLFTDGMSNRRKALEATEESRAQGVAVQTLLLGESIKGARILDEIASGTGGSFMWVTDPAKLPEAFLNLRTTGVDSVTLSVNGSQPVPTKLAGGTFAANVPLSLGENRITALATSINEQTKETTVVVTVPDASCASLQVGAVRNGQPVLSLNDRAIEIVVDASNSMWGQIEGTAKIAIAKQILTDATQWLPRDLSLSMRTYGSTSATKERNCTDSQLLVPVGSDNRDAIRAAIGGLQPRGQTPIAFALEQAAADFGDLQSERVIVLMTDGLESCGGDPVASAGGLREQGITVHVIGFGLGNTVDEDTGSLTAIANAGGGEFVTANSADELRTALEATVGTRFSVHQGDQMVASSLLGGNEQLFLPHGGYQVQLHSVPPHEFDVTLQPRDGLSVTLEKRDGAVVESEQRAQLAPASCSALANAAGD